VTNEAAVVNGEFGDVAAHPPVRLVAIPAAAVFG
jgi:hypothetical protein